MGPRGLLRKRPLANASLIEPRRSGTWSPNRFSLFVRLARSWLFLFTLDVYKTWIFLSSNLVNMNWAWSGVIMECKKLGNPQITLTPHLIGVLYLSLSRSSFPLRRAWCLFLISWFSWEHVSSSVASCSFRLDILFCCFVYSVSPSLFRLTLKYINESMHL